MIRSDDPLASAAIRLAPSPRGTEQVSPTSAFRPLGLRHLRAMAFSPAPECTYSHREQGAVDRYSRPLLETMGKDWKTKGSSDGEEGPEEHYDWEEE